ncbi:hypothetical protein P1X15_30935 [Runella sp. MFBS21]|uniref:hypothetical protein n=1 Tax=Runella sp. MFBS21 TaxID=3034018 RepID=UPI0023F7F10A|nr:hypothetical protein [Runella sp. MFBS21]MDF7822072.1 hypothetical protein [Runella sp. MFBS21]
MRLVIIDDNLTIVEDFGEFEPDLAKAFFVDAIAALEFQQQLPPIMVQNEVQLRLLTDTLAQMGLLHQNPQAIQLWMRPFIAEEIMRLQQRKGLLARTAHTLDAYREKVFDWLKSHAFAGVSRLLSNLLKRLSR